MRDVRKKESRFIFSFNNMHTQKKVFNKTWTIRRLFIFYFPLFCFCWLFLTLSSADQTFNTSGKVCREGNKRRSGWFVCEGIRNFYLIYSHFNYFFFLGNPQHNCGDFFLTIIGHDNWERFRWTILVQ